MILLCLWEITAGPCRRPVDYSGMSLPGPRNTPAFALPAPVPARATGSSLLVLTCVLCLSVGCQTPPAHLACSDADDSVFGRKGVVLRQIMVDSAVTGVCHPVRSGYTLASELVVDLRAAAAGVYYRWLVLPLAPEPPPIVPDRPTLDPAALEKELRRSAGNELRAADIHLFVNGNAALSALHGVIDSAQNRLDVLMYLWDSDALGEEVARGLAARASPKRPVRVLVDGGGNLIDGLPTTASSAEVNRVVCWLAKQPNVEVLRTRNAAARFDHRKLVVADGTLAWSGGRNFTAPSFFEYHDLSYTLTGPLASDMAEVFDEFWRQEGGTPAPPLPAKVVPPPEGADGLARLVRTRPLHRQLEQALYEAVDQARHHVYVENPYFSDPRLLAKLAAARQRGADVRVVLTVRSGTDAVDHSNRVTANRLLRAGIRVYLYPGMTHVKATSVDGLWAYLGTGNFDYLSLRHNRELGVAVGAGLVLAALEEMLFLPDFRAEWELTEPLPVAPVDYFYEALASLVM
jgi:cardiolipin synthase